MLKYDLPELSPAALAKLASWQTEVNAQSSHATMYEYATQRFKNKDNATFEEIREILALHAPADGACYYCERDRYRDIEHIFPKRHYPQACFDWHNYIYACTICNQDKKRDTFAVLDANAEVVQFDRSHDIATPVPTGQAVLINIRHENPFDFLQLDLETGELVPIGDSIAQKRARFTLDLLALNESSLASIRKQHVRHYKNYLQQFQHALTTQDARKQALALAEIQGLGHPTVLAEMRRQMHLFTELIQLFHGIPAHIGIHN